MSELLHTCGEVDSRVRPLIFLVRRWAEEANVTTKVRPCQSITNFQLTCLVLYFLQQLQGPILPPLARMMKQENVLATNAPPAIKSLSELNFRRTNNDTLEQLVEQFFNFYSEFNFSKHRICLQRASISPQTYNVGMDISNPLDVGRNIGKNVMGYKSVEFNRKAGEALKTLRNMQRNKQTSLLSLLAPRGDITLKPIAQTTKPSHSAVRRPGTGARFSRKTIVPL